MYDPTQGNCLFGRARYTRLVWGTPSFPPVQQLKEVTLRFLMKVLVPSFFFE
uniref:Uncharacterized protein n=1 Tax=Anguilla anguilla TaxID=7936 RepID=A0A0E9RF63_ANGAN